VECCELARLISAWELDCGVMFRLVDSIGET